MALYSCRKVVAAPPKWWVAEEPELEVIEVKALSKLHTLPGNTLVDIPACSVLWADSAVRPLFGFRV